MSFLDGISKPFGDILGSVVQIAALAFIAKQISHNTAPASQVSTTNAGSTTVTGSPVTVPAGSENKVPVLYGTSYLGGTITDAVMTNSNQTMYFAITLSEKTGLVYSTNTASNYLVQDVYWNNQRIIFQDDGVTCDYTVDTNSIVDSSLHGNLKIYCYKGNSDSPAIPEGFTNANPPKAYEVMPGWSSGTHMMNDLIFAIVELDYNQANSITSLGQLLFHIQNTLHLPGDVLYDYMTNTRYGAGIDPTEILTS
jgi:hypothetical protein